MASGGRMQPKQLFSSNYQRSENDHLDHDDLAFDAYHGEEEGHNRHLRKLQFCNPGRAMEEFHPGQSTREMRKMNRKIYSQSRKNQVYDESGLIMMDGRDICDCLEQYCPGCHYPCSRCHNTKCGGECRVNRRWIYQELELEGTNKKVYFPGPPQPFA